MLFEAGTSGVSEVVWLISSTDGVELFPEGFEELLEFGFEDSLPEGFFFESHAVIENSIANTIIIATNERSVSF